MSNSTVTQSDVTNVTQGSSVVEISTAKELMEWINGNDKRGRMSQTAVEIQYFVESGQKWLCQTIHGMNGNKTPAEQAHQRVLNLRNYISSKGLDNLKVVKRANTYTLINLGRLNAQEKNELAPLLK